MSYYPRRRTSRYATPYRKAMQPFKSPAQTAASKRSAYLAKKRMIAQEVADIQSLPPSAFVIPGVTRMSGYYGGMEKKFLDTAISDATAAATMTMYNICIVPQGDTESQRVGRKITVKAIQLRGSLSLLGATDVTNTSCQVRMRIVCDTQTNGAAFTATDLLETDAINSFSNLANRSRFVVLKDRTFALKAGGACATGAAYAFSEDIVVIDTYKGCNIPIEYDNSATTGAITTVRSNSLWITFQCSTAEIVAVSGTARIRYVDG